MTPVTKNKKTTKTAVKTKKSIQESKDDERFEHPIPDKPWLKCWKKGYSGNPGGKPKGAVTVKSFKQILDKIGAENLLESPLVTRGVKRKFYSQKKVTMKEGVMRIVYNMALAGKDWACRYIADYSEGKPKEFHEITDKTVTIDIDNETDNELPEGEELCIDEKNTVSVDSPNN